MEENQTNNKDEKETKKAVTKEVDAKEGKTSEEYLKSINTTNKPVNIKGFGALNGFEKFLISLGVIICIAAIAEFIYWVVRPSGTHGVLENYMGVAFLSVSACTLVFLLVRPTSKRIANIFIAIGIIAAIVLPAIGIAIG